MNPEFPNIPSLIISGSIVFFGTICSVFISNNLTFLLQQITSNATILIIFHILIISFFFHFVRLFTKYLETQSSIVKFDNDAYLDTVIVVGPTIGASSNYLGKYVRDFLFKK